MFVEMRKFAGCVLTRLFVGIVVCYQGMIRPLLGGSCRFHPTCSAYAIDALRGHGPFRGVWMAAKRLARCNGWSAGGFDPVPPNPNATS